MVPFFFEAALSVNLTTMLVMTTIFISKMEGLPPTSDIKMIDIWLVLCQMVPFAEVVLLTAMEYQREDQSTDDITSLATIADAEEDKAMLSVAGWRKLIRCPNLPQLKTLGLLAPFLKILNFNKLFFREKGASLLGSGKLCRLLHLGFNFLF